MSDEQEHLPLSSEEMRRSWRLVTWAGLLGSVYYLFCIGGAPRIKYLTELGATAFHFGLIAGLGAFAIVFQIASSILANRVPRRKPAWMLVAIAHRVLFLPVLLAPLLFESTGARIAWIIVFFLLHDMLAQMSGPIWLAWMADLVPRDSMTRYWAARQRFILGANLVAIILLAFGFDYFEKSGKVILGFTLVAVVGVMLGVTDILLFTGVPEPPNERPASKDWFEHLVQPLRDRAFRPYLKFIGYYHFAVFLAWPFFGLFQIESLQLSVRTVQLLGTAGAIGVVVSSRFWGLLCDAYGYRPALQMIASAKAVTPVLFMLTPKYPAVGIPILAVLIFFDGVLNSGFGLAMQGVLMRSTPRKNRAMYIAATNFFAVGIMAGIAPILSGRLIDFVNRHFTLSVGVYQFNGYLLVFALSAVFLVLGGFTLASKIQEVGKVPLGVIVRQCRSLDTFRVTRLVYRLQEASDDSDRTVAARRLGEKRNPLAIGQLIDSLQDASQSVRKAAADALGKIGVAEAAEPLARTLFDSRSGIQSRAARALGRIGGADSLKALLANLKNQDEKTLIETIDGLARIGDHAAIVPLICLFHEVESEPVRQRIVKALGRLGETPMVEVLAILLGRRPIELELIRYRT